MMKKKSAPAAQAGINKEATAKQPQGQESASSLLALVSVLQEVSAAVFKDGKN